MYAGGGIIEFLKFKPSTKIAITMPSMGEVYHFEVPGSLGKPLI